MAETTTKKKSVFETLNKINVNEHTEQKNGLTYLSWAWAWAEVKKNYPDAAYSIKRFENNLPYVYDANTGYMVFTEVTINGITHEMWLPVMDNNNKAMKSEEYKFTTRYNKEVIVKQADMFDINKTIMRCLVKNLAIFGLGLYIYAGEDLPAEMPEQIAERKLQGEKVNIPSADEFAATVKANKKEPALATKAQQDEIIDLCKQKGKQLDKLYAYYKVKGLEELTDVQAAGCIKILKELKA
jgi:hypothetical protein